MKNEVGIKSEALLSALSSNLAKKPKTVRTVEFSAEVSKKVEGKSELKAKGRAEKSDAVSNPVKPENSKDDHSNKETEVTAGKAEKTAESEDNIVAMQVQQLAINTLTVESKEDIPEIKLPNVAKENLETTEEKTNKAETLLTEKVEVKEGLEANVQKFAKVQEAVKVEVPKTEVSTKLEEKIETKVQTEEKTLQVDTVKAVEQKEGAQADSSKNDLTVNVSDRPLDLAKVNIKVADAPLKANSPQMPEQLVDKILYNVDKGKHVFDIELFPDNLGKLEIKMVFEKGAAELMMTTHTEKAHKLLSQQLDTIKTILEANTQNQSSVEVKASEKSSENFDRDNFAGQKEKEQQEQNPKRNSKEETESFVERLKFGLLEEAE